MSATEKQSALEGIRVIDFSWAVSGPFATRILADHGAQVIKIERPGGEIVRGVLPFPDEKSGVNRSGMFNNFNRNKYGMTLNMQNSRGIELAKKLVSMSHLVIENFSSGVIEKLGLGYEELCKVKPDIIMVSMPAFGHSGPYRNHIGYGQTLHNFSSFFDLIGHSDGPTVGLAFAYSDYIAGCMAATTAMAALHRWRKTGKGSYIEVPQLEALCEMLGPSFLDYFVNQRVARRCGNRQPRHVREAAPHGVYPCKGDDRWCAIAVFTEDEWQAFSGAIGEPEWTKDPKFSTMHSRLENVDVLDRLVATWTKDYTPDEVMEKLQSAGVGAGAVREIRDLVETDPQMKEFGFYVEADHPELGKRLFEGNPFRLSDTPGQIRRSSPLLGEHNDFICKEILGMSEEEINRYIIEGVLV